MADMLAPQPSDRREWPRYLAEREVKLAINIAGREHNCLVKDISLGGARLSCEAPLPDSEDVVFAHPDAGRVAGKRLWCSETELGVEFDFSDESLTLISQCLRAMLDDNSPQRAVAH